MYSAGVHSLRLEPQRPIVDFTEPSIVVTDVSMQFESRLSRLRDWTDPLLNALLRHTLPPTRLLPRRTFWALQHVTFTVYPGEVVLLVGDHGAGKSTLIKLLAGALSPTSGTIRVGGRVSPTLDPADAAALSASDDVDILLIDCGPSRAELPRSCCDLIDRSSHRDATIVIASKDLTSVASVCTRTIWLGDGKVIADDLAQEIIMQYVAWRDQGDA
jgi:ABC-type polysaccharide/polyol phosphate transport system ATPase subunit